MKDIVKEIVSLGCLLVSMLLALPLAVLGFLGIVGRLADAEYQVNAWAGLQFLAIALLVFAPSALWCWRRHRKSIG